MRSAPFYNFLMEAALCGSVMILAALALRPLLRRRAGSRAIYWAWLLIAARLLLPFSYPNPVMNGLRPTLSGNAAVRPIADQVRVRLTDAALDAGYAMVGTEYDQLGDNLAWRIGLSLEYGQLGRWAMIGYLAALAGVSAWMLARNVRFRRRLKRDRVGPLTDGAREEYQALCGRVGIKPPPVWTTRGLSAACAVGAFRPYIAVPEGLAGNDLKQALAHELGHIRAHDGVWALVRGLCCAVHWPNPLVWLAASLSRADGELACDERVAAPLPASERLDYANALAHGAQGRGPGIGVLATGERRKERRMKRRMTAVATAQPRHRAAAAVFLSLACAAPALRFATSEAAQTPSVVAYSSLSVREVTLARRESVPDEASAVRFFEKLLRSPYLGVDATGLSSIVTLSGEKWVAWGTLADGSRLSAVFTKDGVITAYNNEYVVGGVTRKSDEPYKDSESRSMGFCSYVSDFAYATLPGASFESVAILSDEYNGHGRFLRFSTGNERTATAHSFVLQISPEVRVLSFQLLDDENLSLLPETESAG